MAAFRRKITNGLKNVVLSRLATVACGLAFIVMFLNGLVTGHQICHNCGNSTECSSEIENATDEGLYQNCWNRCNNRPDCKMAMLDSRKCRIYNCSLVAYELGSKAYIEKHSTGCEEYEIIFHSSYAGNCHITNTIYKPNLEECLSVCFETSLCRGLTFDSSTNECNIHDNTTCSYPLKTLDLNKTFVQRVCYDEDPPCTRPYIQKCIDCRAGYLCPKRFDSISSTTPGNFSTTDLGVESDLKQIWWYGEESKFMYKQCTYVRQLYGHHVYRLACSQDCPTYQLHTLIGHRGTCGQMFTMPGELSLEYCMDKCLDMDGCRGVTFTSENQECYFHNCTDYTADPSSDFLARICVNETTGLDCNPVPFQTCHGCGPADMCPSPYIKKKWVSTYEYCEGVRASENVSRIVHFNRYYSRCDRYDCSTIRQRMGHITYRQTCNTDCLEFELFTIANKAGTCDVIYEEEGGFEFVYCIEKCLDMPGCRGTSYNEPTGRCTYHNCTDYAPASGSSFMWKRCIYDVPAIRPYNQICVDCVNKACQLRDVKATIDTWQECQNHFMNSTDMAMYVFNSNETACRLYNCSWVGQDPSMFRMVFRRSYSADCPIFRLFEMKGYIGTCQTIGYTEGGVSLTYCLDKCLDMDGCLGVSHNPYRKACFYHNCIEREVNSTYTFVKRVCLTEAELNEAKNYTQTCKNCKNMCVGTVSTQPNETLITACNTTCQNCLSIVYEPSIDQCSQYYCDRPMVLGEGTYLTRKTPNPECPYFEMMARSNSTPNCVAHAYDEGQVSSEFCFMRCFDDPMCMSVVLDADGQNCTYHSCTDYVGGGPGYLVSKSCLSGECMYPWTQTCLNCKQGTLCQSPFLSIPATSSSDCEANCGMEPECSGTVFDDANLVCNLHNCSHVTRQYGSTLYRNTCSDDCPVYEVYTLEAYTGKCPVMSNMTEYFMFYPEICYQRCLDTVGCRGVSFVDGSTCYYHESCDCRVPYTGQNSVFWWRYCMNETDIPTVVQSSSSTSSLELSVLLPSSSTCKPPPIFLVACFCSSGSFKNLDMDDIVKQLITNLTVDPHTTSFYLRRFISAQDDRKSAVAVGTVGVAILAGITGAVLILDLTNVIRMAQKTYRKFKKLKTLAKKKKILNRINNKRRESLFDDEVQTFDSFDMHVYSSDVPAAK